MRAGIFLAYWPWFSPEEQVELAILADGLGLDSVWISEAWPGRGVSAGAARGPHRQERARVRPVPDPGRAAGGDGDGRRDARRDLRRPLPARPRGVRAAGVGGLVRRAVRPPG